MIIRMLKYIGLCAILMQCTQAIHACPWCVGQVDNESPAFFSDSCYRTPEESNGITQTNVPHETEEQNHE